MPFPYPTNSVKAPEVWRQ